MKKFLTIINKEKIMKIIKLTAENIKRISAVEITPDGNLVVIAGKNAQGKSSVLDSIVYALQWRLEAKNVPLPIKIGEEKGIVKVELDDLIVEREFKGSNTYLKVTTKDGTFYPTPQSILDKLIGELSFDPLEFTKLSPKEQVNSLIKAFKVGIDLTEWENRYKAIYDQRTAINKEFKKVEALKSQIELPPDVDKIPDEEIPVNSINEELEKAYEIINKNKEAENLLNELKVKKEHKEREIAELKARLKKAQDEYKEISLRISKGEEVIKNLPKINIDDIKAKLQSVESINRKVRIKRSYSLLDNQAGELKVQSDQLTHELERLNEEKASALQNANLMKGLSFNDAGITYNGIPFSQCSAAEQLKISLAIAMELNPKLRVIRIKDGSLLDKDNLKLIEKMAKEKDYQVWIERVETDDEIAVIIEDGMIKTVKTKEKRNGRNTKI